MTMNDLPMALFTSEDGQIRLQLKLVDETLWLTQRQMADLYEKSSDQENSEVLFIVLTTT